jgi:hypothetical protein
VCAIGAGADANAPAATINTNGSGITQASLPGRGGM